MWPTFRTLWLSLLSKPPRKRSPRRRPAFCRPHLEVLEDRTVPVSLGHFSTALNATVYATAVDSAGNTYVTGKAGSSLPTTPGAFQTSGSGTFAAKLNPAGAVVYATYLGSGGAGTGIAVDAAGDAYVIGEAGTVAATANAIASSPNSNDTTDFVAELNPTGSGLNYATYLPGTIDGSLDAWSYAGAIAVDGSGNIDVAGYAGSGLPVTAGAFQTASGGAAFFMKINPGLSGAASVLYASYLGGSSTMDAATGIAVDGAGNAYLEGYTGSSDFPTTPGAFQRTFGGPALNDVFVAKFDPALSGAASLVYSTYLGGTSTLYEEHYGAGYVPNINAAIVVPELAGGIAVDGAGNAYVTSATNFTNFPTTLGAYQTSINNQPPPSTFPASDAFVTKLNATGSALVYSTYLGGGTNGSGGTSSGGAGVAVDANGDAFVTGWTNSTSFPTLNPVQATNGTGFFDSFVTELNPAGSGLLFSTYLGSGSGNGYDGYGIGLDSAGNVYVGGEITSSPRNYPTGGFAAKINLAPSPSFSITGFPSSTTAGVPQTFTVTALNADGTVNTGYTGTVHFTSSDPRAVLPADYTFTDADQGLHPFTATLKTAGSQSITATDTATGSITGSESGIAVQPAAASQFILGAPSSVASGKKFSVTLTVEDAYGNVVTGYTGTVHFTSSDGTATLPKNFTFTAADNGVYTFTNAFILKKRGTQTLTVTDTQNSALTATDSISVS
jgi:hypothetical protein